LLEEENRAVALQMSGADALLPTTAADFEDMAQLLARAGFDLLAANR
jgi:hypothetical protein